MTVVVAGLCLDIDACFVFATLFIRPRGLARSELVNIMLPCSDLNCVVAIVISPDILLVLVLE